MQLTKLQRDETGTWQGGSIDKNGYYFEVGQTVYNHGQEIYFQIVEGDNVLAGAKTQFSHLEIVSTTKEKDETKK